MMAVVTSMPAVTGKEPVMAQFTVFVDDNFNFMNEDERYSSGTFETYEAAVAKAKKIINQFLKRHYKPGTTAEELYAGWAHHGESPFITGNHSKEHNDEVVAYSKAIAEQLEARIQAHSTFDELNKPLNLMPPEVFFNASEYARKRCNELCNNRNLSR
jgi:hypothetical protein